jgi:hypothetical protein
MRRPVRYAVAALDLLVGLSGVVLAARTLWNKTARSDLPSDFSRKGGTRHVKRAERSDPTLRGMSEYAATFPVGCSVRVVSADLYTRSWSALTCPSASVISREIARTFRFPNPTRYAKNMPNTRATHPTIWPTSSPKPHTTRSATRARSVSLASLISDE